VEENVRRILLSLTVLALLGLGPREAIAAIGRPAVVFDLRAHSDNSNATSVYPIASMDANLEKALEALQGDVDTNPKKPAETALLSELGAVATSGRFVTGKGDIVDLWIVFDSASHKDPSVKPEETARKTQLESDLGTLVKIAQKVVSTKTVNVDEPTSVRTRHVEYRLVRVRASLAVTATAEPVKGDQAKTVTAKATATTGPTEHFYISTDLPINKPSELKYDDATHTLKSKEAPSEFYAGLNFLLGDVLDDNRKVWQSLLVKGLVRISKHPLDGFGVAVGYRLQSVKAFGFELDAFSPFVGYIWTKQDAQPDAGATVPDTQRRGQFHAGLGLNLDKALDWVK
jgi:hypothetical protein